MDTLIAPVFVSVLRAYDQLCARLNTVRDYEEEVPQSSWQDEFGRLRVWGANIGAHQNGTSSLDFRLRDASHIRGQVVKILYKFARTIKEVNEFLDQTTQERLAINVDEDSDDEDSDDEEPTTELQQMFEQVVTLVGCLYQMSMLIRKPSSHDQLMMSEPEDWRIYEEFDIKHVRDKYPACDVRVAERLGRSISQRRKYFKYRERHRAKLQKGINEAQEGDETTLERQSTALSDTVASAFTESNVHFQETASESGASATSYTPSILGQGQSISVPPPPKDSADERPFECPLCFYIITVENRTLWARHVFRDLQPYSCTFRDCPKPRKLYYHRHDWFNHELTTHWEDLLRERTDASGTVDIPALGDLTLPLKRKVPLRSSCPLCPEVSPSIGQLEKHLGRHLLEIALFALPSYEDNEGDEESAGLEDDSDTIDDKMSNVIEDSKAESERLNDYFHDGEGISRTVLEAYIHRYLGNDALAIPGTHQGRHGYVIRARRNLNSNMILDIKADSADPSRREEALSRT
ncbi:hypothetical protein FQN54_000969 [Arachnomyces sp. PD_36]|nr:hypothetical protein FQN54_000969 [Arachnomyces sp. PD_36]